MNDYTLVRYFDGLIGLMPKGPSEAVAWYRPFIGQWCFDYIELNQLEPEARRFFEDEARRVAKVLGTQLVASPSVWGWTREQKWFWRIPEKAKEDQNDLQKM